MWRIRSRLRPRLLLLTDYARRENRVGQLDWTKFRENPLDTSVTHDFLVGGARVGPVPGAAPVCAWATACWSSAITAARPCCWRHPADRLLRSSTCTASPGSTALKWPWSAAPPPASPWQPAFGCSGCAPFLPTLLPPVPLRVAATPLDLARETRRVLPYFGLPAEWRVGRPRGGG